MTAAVVMIMMWMDSMPRSWEARNRAFSVKTALTPTVDNVVLTLYNECVDELLAISDLVDKGKLEKALRRVRRLTEMHREFYSGGRRS